MVACWSAAEAGNHGAIDREARAWSAARSAAQTGVGWRFTTGNARIKLKRLYPKIVE